MKTVEKIYVVGIPNTELSFDPVPIIRKQMKYGYFLLLNMKKNARKTIYLRMLLVTADKTIFRLYFGI